ARTEREDEGRERDRDRQDRDGGRGARALQHGPHEDRLEAPQPDAVAHGAGEKAPIAGIAQDDVAAAEAAHGRLDYTSSAARIQSVALRPLPVRPTTTRSSARIRPVARSTSRPAGATAQV